MYYPAGAGGRQLASSFTFPEWPSGQQVLNEHVSISSSVGGGGRGGSEDLGVLDVRVGGVECVGGRGGSCLP